MWCAGTVVVYQGSVLTVSPTCDFCGATAPGPDLPLTWVTSLENGKPKTYCERCAREHLRSIEGKLDSEWW
jgi:hypothetical protein